MPNTLHPSIEGEPAPELPYSTAPQRGEERTADAPQEDNAGTADGDAVQGDLPEELQRALAQLVRDYELESDSVRRHYVRRFQEAEEFWKGNQNLYWAERDFRWHTPFELALERGSADDLPRYDYVTNLYQAFGLSVIAAISQRLPRVRFEPVSTMHEEDVATARAASQVAELIQRNNKMDLLAIREAYLLWTQGLFGAYVRYVVDEEFGTHPETSYEWSPVEVQAAGWVCPECGKFTAAGMGGLATPDAGTAWNKSFQPAASPWRDQPTEAEIPSGGAEVYCSHCGQPLPGSSYRPAEVVDVPVISRVTRVPNGQEKISIYGGLNLKLMPFASDLHESGYLILAEEQHVGALRAAYPAQAERIAPDAGAGDIYERQARLSLLDPPGGAAVTSYDSLVTYRRCWLRPWAFWAHNDPDVRQRLLTAFPEGCMVALAGDLFLEARAERLDDHWRICRAMPGSGMYCEPIGGSLISIQKRVNDIANIQAEHVEYGAAPPVLYDARYINGEALANKRMEPASYTPVVIDGPGSKGLAEMIFQPRIGLDPNIYAQGRELMELSQFLTGALPAVFGGNMQDVTTASGYGMARDQALGRLSLFWRQIKQFQADLMLIAVECFRRNRTADVEQVVLHRSGEYVSRFIQLGDLKGNVTAHPETDETVPILWNEMRQNILQLLQSHDPELLAILSHPLNAGLLRNYLGVPGIVLPDDDNRSKQFRELDDLLRSEPVWVEGQGWTPTVMPEVSVDDHRVHIETLREWAVSDDGLDMKQRNPGGYSNVLAHLTAHQRILALQAELASGEAPASGNGRTARTTVSARPHGKSRV